MSAVIQLAERVVVLNFGKLIADGKPDVVMQDPRSSTRTSDGQALLEVTGLAAGYLGERVIDDIDVEVRTGEAVAIVGSNGGARRRCSGRLPDCSRRWPVASSSTGRI